MLGYNIETWLFDPTGPGCCSRAAYPVTLGAWTGSAPSSRAETVLAADCRLPSRWEFLTQTIISLFTMENSNFP